jgi:chitinase
MTYDLTGTWNPYSWHNAALYGPSDNAVWSIDMAVKRFTNAGVPVSKLSVGIPFYGWQWSGGGITGPKQRWSSTPNLRQIYYQELAPLITAQNRNWDSLAQVPYLCVSSGTAPLHQFVTYDDPQSIMAKINYAKDKGLGGWIIWELAADYLPAQTPNQPLLAAVKTSLSTSRFEPVHHDAPKLSSVVSAATATVRQAEVLPLRTNAGQ